MTSTKGAKVKRVIHEGTRRTTNDNWRQNVSALLSRWCDPVMGGSPPGSAGVPPAQILPRLRPSPPPETTGSGALPLLRPGPCGSRRQGGRLQHRRETERQPKGQHAGGTPALPGGCRPDGEVGGIRRATSLKAGLSPLGNSRLPASRAPALPGGSYESETIGNRSSLRDLGIP